MRQNLLTIFLLLSISTAEAAEDAFKFLGSYDNVKSTESGHCYGNSVSIWEMNDQKLIGLFNVDMGLCGDPPCSVIEGTINNEKIKFKTSFPIYDEFYSFIGHITTSELSGLLNNSNTTLNKNSRELQYKNINEWCAMWSKVQRCSGVKELCK